MQPRFQFDTCCSKLSPDTNFHLIFVARRNKCSDIERNFEYTVLVPILLKGILETFKYLYTVMMVQDVQKMNILNSKFYSGIFRKLIRRLVIVITMMTKIMYWMYQWYELLQKEKCYRHIHCTWQSKWPPHKRRPLNFWCTWVNDK